MAEINIATKEGNKLATGKVCRLYVGNYQYKFLLQESKTGVCLTHWESGQIVVPENTIKAVKVRNFKSYHVMTDREAALIALNDIVQRSGDDKVRAVLDGAPKIND